MNFAWDEDKNRINMRKHGFDFADAGHIFAGPMLIGRIREKIMAKIVGSESVFYKRVWS